METEATFNSSNVNVTGTRRVVKDAVGNTYNSIQRWNKLNVMGHTIINKLIQSKLEKQDLADDPCTLQLYDIMENLADIGETIKRLATQIQKLVEYDSQKALVSSNSNQRLVELTGQIAEAYRNEVQVKKLVLENLPFVKNECDLVFLAEHWIYEIHINGDINDKLKILLIDVGYKHT